MNTLLIALRILLRVGGLGWGAVANVVATVCPACWAAWLKFYNHISRRLDRIFETGWRRLFGWVAIAVAMFSYIYAPLHGLVIDTAGVNTFLAFATAMYGARSAEKVMLARTPGVAMGPGAAAGY